MVRYACWAAVIAAALAGGAVPWLATLSFLAVLVMLCVELGLATARGSEQKRLHEKLLRDAEYEHAALLTGDDMTGTYGHFQPAPIPLCAEVGNGFCAASVDDYCIGGTWDGKCHG